MLIGIIKGLIVAWLLSLFNVDVMLINAIQSFTSVELNVSMYYVLFAVVGIVGELISNKTKTIKVKVDKED